MTIKPHLTAPPQHIFQAEKRKTSPMDRAGGFGVLQAPANYAQPDSFTGLQV